MIRKNIKFKCLVTDPWKNNATNLYCMFLSYFKSEHLCMNWTKSYIPFSQVDEKTGFKTKSILCMPIKNAQNQVIGVCQFVNKLDGSPFNQNDENLFEVTWRVTMFFLFHKCNSYNIKIRIIFNFSYSFVMCIIFQRAKF